MHINGKRLEKNLYEFSKIGKNKEGGIDRYLGSDADRKARKWLLNYWHRELKKDAYIDAIANMWVRNDGQEQLPPIVFGSHHDAVPNGGMFDGAMGVLVATEILQTIIENNYVTKHPFEVISFTGEEPNPYDVSTLGSKVLSGRLKKKDLEKLRSYMDGSSLQDCLKKIGGDIDKADEILIQPGDITAFVECHIEQGRRLYDMGKTAAAVSCITGIYRENITITGEANHAGTTQMNIRHDALVAASDFIVAFDQIVKDVDRPDVVGTISYANVFPNSVGIVPGKVELTLEIRTCKKEDTQSLIEQIKTIAKTMEERYGAIIDRTLNLNQQAMPMDHEVTSYLERSIQLIEEPEVLVSMAGHDAANMQRVTKSSMLFVQSKDGKSHCPQEYTDIDQIIRAANVMLDALLKMDKEMNAYEENI